MATPSESKLDAYKVIAKVLNLDESKPGCVVHGVQELWDKHCMVVVAPNQRIELRRYADAMEKKLAEMDEDRGDSWKREPVQWLMNRLQEELVEAVNEEADCNPDQLQAELVDVGNFAMFIWHRLQERKKECL